jgi:hypothetical protein
MTFLILRDSLRMCWVPRCKLSGIIQEEPSKTKKLSSQGIDHCGDGVFLCRRVGRGSKLIGCGSAVPKKVITNEQLSAFVDTSDEWISQRTGIRNRRVLSGAGFVGL